MAERAAWEEKRTALEERHTTLEAEIAQLKETVSALETDRPLSRDEQHAYLRLCP